MYFKKSLLIIIFFISANLTVTKVFPQGDGPRAMSLAPSGLNFITPAYMFQSSNFNFAQDILIKGADVNANVIPITYSHYFGIGGNFAQVRITPLIFGEVSGSIKNDTISINAPSVNGLADAVADIRIGIINAPALKLQQFVKHRQQPQLYMLFGMTIPIGKYSQDSPLNLGTNRWAFRIGMPMVLPIGTNPLRMTYWEFTPSLNLFTDNNEPYKAEKRSQSALFTVESHLTHNFTKQFWAGIDARFQQGGETETDGIYDGNSISQLGGGFSAGYTIIAPLSIQGTYGTIITGEDSIGDMYRLRLVMLF